MPHTTVNLQEHGKDDEHTPLLGRAVENQGDDDQHTPLERVLSGNATDFVGPGLDIDAQKPPLPRSRSRSNASEHVNSVERPPVRGKTRGLLVDMSDARFWLLMSSILLQYFVAMFDSTLMASSHPVITSYFNASNKASWLSTAFLLTATAFQPLYGRVSDTFGRKPLYIFALVMFVLTTVWCALAQSIISFIAARAFCGLGAGGVLAMGSIMINDLVSIEVRGLYQSYINLAFGLGSACGAAFGGFLCDKLGWRWTFGIQVPPICVILLIAWFATPADLGPNLRKGSDKGVWEIIRGFDLAGSFLLSSSVAFLILGLNLGGNVLPWKHPFIISSLILSVIAGALLIWVESRAERPVMPLSMLFSSPRGNLVFSNFFSVVGIISILFNAPLYFQAVKLESASVSGFRLAAPSLAITVFGVSAGFLMTWTGRMKFLIVAGGVSMLIGGIALSAMWDGIPTWLATLFIVPPSLGQGLAFPATSIAVLATSMEEEQAVMTSILVLFRSLGNVMGVAISSLAVQNALTVYLDQLVTGPRKAEVIEKVRRSVHAVSELGPKHQAQVIEAYSKTLRVAFASSIIVFVIVLVLVIPLKLPRLKKRS